MIHGLNGADGKADWKLGAAYSRDALAILLKECPEITGITLRVHGESGVPEGTYDFWQTLFEAIAGAGRKIEIEMHAKGINQIMIDMAVKTGQPVKVGPKFSAEHQSLGYHQADIRELEIPTPGRMEQGVFAVSNGERRFTRYGYADLVSGRPRLRHSLSAVAGHAEASAVRRSGLGASAMGRAANFCGADGLGDLRAADLQGPRRLGPSRRPQRLSGRRHRQGLAQVRGELPAVGPAALQSRRHARQLAPQPEAQVRRQRGFRGARAVRRQPRAAAGDQRAYAVGVQPFAVGTEMYTNQPIVSDQGFVPYTDTPSPRVFANVSPLDPQLFSTITEHADDLLAGRANAKYSPAEVAAWLDDLLFQTDHALTDIDPPHDAATRRLVEDAAIQSGIAHFFSAKLRAGLYFALWQKAKSRDAGARADRKLSARRAMPGRSWRSAPKAFTPQMSPMAKFRSGAVIGPTGWRRSMPIWRR